jgi:iron complex outermembrane receptor protein
VIHHLLQREQKKGEGIVQSFNNSQKRSWSCILKGGVAFLALITSGTAWAQQGLDGAGSAEEAVAPDEVIIVTGSRLPTSGFTAPTPVTVVGADLIQRQAATNIADVLNQLPSFRPQGSRATGGVFGNNLGAQTADLRGLGANRSLVLIDGRRVVAGTVGGGSLTPGGAVDLNIVPTSIVARAEVVTGGASAAYGSDAVAGVVNLIIDDRIEGIRAQAHTEISQLGDNEEYSFSLAGGTKFAGGRGHIVLAGEFVHAAGTGDCYTRDWCAESYQPVQNSAPGANGLPATNVLPNSRTATIAPGGLINAGPLRGTAFDAAGVPVAYPYGTYYGSGLFMSGGSFMNQSGFFQFFPLVVPLERYNLFGNIKYELGDDTEVFLQTSYASIIGTVPQSQIRETALTIQRDNAFLPASVRSQMTSLGISTVTVGRLGNDFGPSVTSTDRNTMRIATGIKGAIGGNWKWDAYYQFGRTKSQQVTANDKINANFTRAIDAVVGPTGSIVCRSTLSTNAATAAAAAGCLPLNIFGENQWSSGARDYVFGTARTNITLSQHVVAANLNGQLFDIGAGPVSIALGGEYRKEQVRGSTDPISQAGGFFVNNGIAVNGAMEVAEGYVETAIPLARDTAWAKLLELNGAARYTHYNTAGGVATWKFGAVYKPFDWLRLRGTRSRDIRAPNLFELYSPLSRALAAIRNPTTNVQTLTPIFSGGNTSLKEETANTLTFGAVIEPTGALDGLRFSADYFDIKIDDVIAQMGGQIIANQCAAGSTVACGYITFDANRAITAITNPLFNLNRLKVRGIDFEALYRFRTGGLFASEGTITLQATATHMLDLVTVDISGTAINRAGMNGSPNGQVSGMPSWSINGQATIEEGAVSLTTQVRYISGGVYDATLVGPDQPGYSPSLSNSININRVPAQAYVNLQFQWTIKENANGKRLQIYGAVNNLFNNDPPNYINSPFGPTNPVLYDVVGRTFRFGVRIGL